jgi:hypothetical protein
MMVSPELRLHEDALFELARSARAFAYAIARAVDTSARLPADTASELTAHVIDDCRAALLPALVLAPGVLQIFSSATEAA